MAAQIYREMQGTTESELNIRGQIDPRLLVPMAIERLSRQDARAVRSRLIEAKVQERFQGDTEVNKLLDFRERANYGLGCRGRPAFSFRIARRYYLPTHVDRTTVRLSEARSSPAQQRLLDFAFDAAGIEPAIRKLYSGMSPSNSAKSLLSSTMTDRNKFRENWKNLFRKNDFQFEGSLRHLVCEAVTVCILALALLVPANELFSEALKVSGPPLAPPGGFLSRLIDPSIMSLIFSYAPYDKFIAVGVTTVLLVMIWNVLSDIFHGRNKYDEYAPLLIWLGPIVLSVGAVRLDRELFIPGLLGSISLAGIAWIVVFPVFLKFGLISAGCMLFAMYGLGALFYITGAMKENRMTMLRVFFDRSDFGEVASPSE